MKVKKNILIALSALFIFLFLFIFAPKKADSDLQNNLLDAGILPESELDILLLERGIDKSIIEHIPVLEKQYLINCEVQAISFGEEISSVWESCDVNKLHSNDFSLRTIFARIRKERGGEFYPCYRVIVIYEWKKLPVWTGNDNLFLKYDDKVWTPRDDDYMLINYERKKDSIIKLFSTKDIQFVTPGTFLWEIDIRRELGSVVRDGYVAITLERRNCSKENEEEAEIQICYTHNIMGVTGNDGTKPRKDIRARHSFIARVAHFENNSETIK